MANHGYQYLNHGYQYLNHGYQNLNHGYQYLNHGYQNLNHGYQNLNHGYQNLNHAMSLFLTQHEILSLQNVLNFFVFSNYTDIVTKLNIMAQIWSSLFLSSLVLDLQMTLLYMLTSTE